MSIVKNGKLQSSEQSNKAGQSDVTFHYLETTAAIDGKPFNVESKLKEVSQGVFHYSLHAIKKGSPQISGKTAESNPDPAVDDPERSVDGEESEVKENDGESERFGFAAQLDTYVQGEIQRWAVRSFNRRFPCGTRRQ